LKQRRQFGQKHSKLSVRWVRRRLRPGCEPPCCSGGGARGRPGRLRISGQALRYRCLSLRTAWMPLCERISVGVFAAGLPFGGVRVDGRGLAF
jgi:hypothetical protein